MVGLAVGRAGRGRGAHRARRRRGPPGRAGGRPGRRRARGRPPGRPRGRPGGRGRRARRRSRGHGLGRRGRRASTPSPSASPRRPASPPSSPRSCATPRPRPRASSRCCGASPSSPTARRAWRRRSTACWTCSSLRSPTSAPWTSSSTTSRCGSLPASPAPGRAASSSRRSCAAARHRGRWAPGPPRRCASSAASSWTRSPTSSSPASRPPRGPRPPARRGTARRALHPAGRTRSAARRGLAGVAGSGRRYREPDLRFGELLAGRISIVLDNAGLSAQALEAERRLAAALDALGEAVTINDRDGRTIYANRAAAALLGRGPRRSSTVARSARSARRFAIYDEAGAPVRALRDARLPGAGGRGGTPPPLLVRNVVKATGEERWLLNKVTRPARRRRASLERVVNVIEDVTEVKRAERRASGCLAEATRALLARRWTTSSTLAARRASRRCRSWPTGAASTCPAAAARSRSVAIAHVDPERGGARAASYARATRCGCDAPADLTRVMRDGVVAELHGDPRRALVEADRADAEHLAAAARASGSARSSSSRSSRAGARSAR